MSNSLLYLFDVERIEVLKGPQGTLFGRNTTGGAVLINSKRPEFFTEGYFTLGTANQDHHKIEGVFNTALTEQTAIRLGFSQQDYDYSSNNLAPGYPQSGMKQNNFRFLLSHQTEQLDVLFKLHGADWEGNVKPVRSKGYIADLSTGELCPPELAGSTACTDNFGFNVGSDAFHDVRLDDNSPHSTERFGGSVEFNYRLSEDTTFTSISSVNQLDRLHTFNCDASTARLCDGGLGVDNQTVTQEFRLNQQLGEHYFIAGLFYLDEAIEQDNQIDLFYDARALLTAGPAHFFYDNTVDTQSIGLFGQFDFQISERFTLTTGLRYTKEDIDYVATSTINVPAFAGDFDGVTVPGWNFQGDIEDNDVSGKIALVQKLNEQTSVYYSFNRGFKSGGYNGALAFSPDEARLAEYGPESLKAWEIGMKTHLNDLHLNLAAFYYDYDNQQVFMNQQSSQQLAAPAQVLDNVGHSKIYGAELDISYTPDNHWLLMAGIGYLPEANLDEFINLNGEVIRDNRLPFSSEWNLNGLANYRMDLFDGTLSLQLEFDHQSEFYFDQNQNPYAKQDDYTLWNGNISWESEFWRLSLWGKNLTDEEYSQIHFDMGPSFGLLQDLKGEARRYGVEVTYLF
ncbi:TonB-dependent receptor [Planctobacterium marinum]|uniref:TonB-dependent receptor n=1 Tax=Planctobacterium marinum TaxID=1631968 RepID=A0AA48HQ24_9ALTE|nr:TonB-dependent receptor [Planctobacterium marinum]